jgi:Flp pilus assembly protein TadG
MIASFLEAGRNELGAATIERASSIMIFLLVAFGIVEYGTIINERNTLTQLAREGASLASRNLTTSANMMDLLASTDNALDFKN